MLTIGIVASSTEGAALCYRTICVEGAEMLGPHDHPEVAHGHSFSWEYRKCVDANDWAGVAELMLASAERVAKAGADFLICPDNTMHQASIWWSIARRVRGCILRVEVAKEASSMAISGWRCLGTRY